MTWSSPAYLAYRRNAARAAYFHELVTEQIGRTKDEIGNLKEEIKKEQLAEDLRFLPGACAYDQKLDELTRRVDKLETQFAFALEWECVMEVTFTETYLQDALAFFAGLDPGLMNDAEQRASYAEVAAATSVEALAAELRSRWARNFVDDGGPRRWIKRFRRMGAADLPEDLVQPMEELWGVRHLIVHRAGTVTLDFARRYPHLATTVGDPIHLDPEKLPRYIQAVSEFVGSVEGYFVRRYADRLPDERSAGGDQT